MPKPSALFIQYCERLQREYQKKRAKYREENKALEYDQTLVKESK